MWHNKIRLRTSFIADSALDQGLWVQGYSLGPVFTTVCLPVMANTFTLCVQTKARRHDCPADREGLGQCTWTFLHTMATYYPQHPSKKQGEEITTLFLDSTLVMIVPNICKLGKCSKESYKASLYCLVARGRRFSLSPPPSPLTGISIKTSVPSSTIWLQSSQAQGCMALQPGLLLGLRVMDSWCPRSSHPRSNWYEPRVRRDWDLVGCGVMVSQIQPLSDSRSQPKGCRVIVSQLLQVETIEDLYRGAIIKH